MNALSVCFIETSICWWLNGCATSSLFCRKWLLHSFIWYACITNMYIFLWYFVVSIRDMGNLSLTLLSCKITVMGKMPGEIIKKGGDPSNYAYIILSGAVKVVTIHLSWFFLTNFKYIIVLGIYRGRNEYADWDPIPALGWAYRSSDINHRSALLLHCSSYWYVTILSIRSFYVCTLLIDVCISIYG